APTISRKLAALIHSTMCRTRRWRACRRAASTPPPPWHPTITLLPARAEPASGLLHLEDHAVHGDHPHQRAGRQVGTFHGPERVADLDPAAAGDDRLVQRHHQADVLLGAAVEQRP